MATTRPRTNTRSAAKEAPAPLPAPARAPTTALAYDDLPDNDHVDIVRPEVSALEAITRSEVAMQLDSAHRWPRNVTKFREEAISMATLNVRIAQSCMFSVPRMENGQQKMITGPSVRLAEMCASAWGNMHTGARVIEIGERELTAQAIAWDLEKNLRLTIEAQRSIWGKRGRFSDDMIRVTGMAAISIALRNAIFRVIPRAYVDDIYEQAKSCAVGDAKTLVARRDEWMAWLAKKGIGTDRVFARLGVAGVADITLGHLEVLIGMGSALKSGELQLDDAFPSVMAASVVSGKGKLDTLMNVSKAARRQSEPPAPEPSAAAPVAAPAAPALTWPIVHAALGKADEDWGGELGDGLIAIIAGWTPEQMQLAYDWALAFEPDSGVADADVPERPAFTLLGRQPGEEG